MTRRLRIPGSVAIESVSVEVPAEVSHHARRVLRLSDGTEVEVVDDEGKLFSGVWTGGDDRPGVVTDLAHLTSADDGPELILAVGLIKGSRFETIVEKATELGATTLQPVACARSVVQLSGTKAEAKRTRWERIASAAARQCERLAPMRVELPARLGDVLARHADATHLYGEPRDHTAPWPEVDERRATVAWIGPEGGFDDDEVRALVAAGARPVRLASHVLRADTAAIAMLALAQARVLRNR